MPLLLPFEVFAFGIGLLFGSFLNVCICRLPAHESIVEPRSHCMVCGHPIRWYDNIPVLSWILLRGRCRDCNEPISWRYPAVELATGLWGTLAGARLWQAWFVNGYVTVQRSSGAAFDFSVQAVAFAVVGFLLIGLIVMDWQTQRLPDAFTLTGIGIGLFLVCVQAIFLAPGEGQVLLADRHIRLRSPGSGTFEGNIFLTGPETLIFGRIAAVAGAALLLLAVRWIYLALRKREGMGLGDVKLMMLLAAFLGFTQALFALFVGVLAASVFGLILIARRKGGSTTGLPFGSFLAAGGLAAALFGQPILAWYASLLR